MYDKMQQYEKLHTSSFSLRGAPLLPPICNKAPYKLLSLPVENLSHRHNQINLKSSWQSWPFSDLTPPVEKAREAERWQHSHWFLTDFRYITVGKFGGRLVSVAKSSMCGRTDLSLNMVETLPWSKQSKQHRFYLTHSTATAASKTSLAVMIIQMFLSQISLLEILSLADMASTDGAWVAISCVSGGQCPGSWTAPAAKEPGMVDGGRLSKCSTHTLTATEHPLFCSYFGCFWAIESEISPKFSRPWRDGVRSEEFIKSSFLSSFFYILPDMYKSHQ